MAEKAKPQTWREWVPNHDTPVLITRAELLAKVERLGLKLDYSTLRFWISEGLIPAPVAEKNGLAGMYPWWVIDLVFIIRRLQDERQPLSAIRPRLRAEALLLSGWMQAAGNPGREWLLSEGYKPSPTPNPADLIAWYIDTSLRGFAQAAYVLADLHGEQTARAVEHVSLVFTMADGEALTVPITRPDLPPASGFPLFTSRDPASEDE